eukprot:698014-Rhodomonas_salina.1
MEYCQTTSREIEPGQSARFPGLRLQASNCCVAVHLKVPYLLLDVVPAPLIAPVFRRSDFGLNVDAFAVQSTKRRTKRHNAVINGSVVKTERVSKKVCRVKSSALRDEPHRRIGISNSIL